jgi:hypothetical protein
MSTIDLGELSSAPGTDSSHEFDARQVRRFALVAALILCLVGAAGSAPPGPAGVRLLWSVPISEQDSTTLGPETAYIGTTGPDRGQLTAYDLVTGAVRWSTTEDDNTIGYLQLAEPEGLLLMPGDLVVGPSGVQFSRRTVALDARTGRRLWSEPGEVMVVAGGRMLMADHDDDGAFTGLRLVRLDRLTAVWQRSTADAVSIAFALSGTDPDKIITVTGDGDAEVLRFADGDRIAHATIDWLKPDPERQQYNDLAPSGDHLVVNRSQQGRAELSVYRLDTLAEQWQADSTNGYAFPCGTAVCLSKDQERAA